MSLFRPPTAHRTSQRHDITNARRTVPRTQCGSDPTDRVAQEDWIALCQGERVLVSYNGVQLAGESPLSMSWMECNTDSPQALTSLHRTYFRPPFSTSSRYYTVILRARGRVPSDVRQSTHTNTHVLQSTLRLTQATPFSCANLGTRRSFCLRIYETP